MVSHNKRRRAQVNKVGLLVMLQARPRQRSRGRAILAFCGPAGRCGNGNDIVVCIQSGARDVRNI